MAAFPSYDVEFYSDEVILDPYPHHRAIRDLGPVTWLSKNELYAIGRYDDVRNALRADSILVSGKGVAANPIMNKEEVPTTLISDGERHTLYKRTSMKPIVAGAMKALRGRIQESAVELVDRLVDQKEFDTMRDLAQFLPLSIVAHLVGLPDAGRENLLKWAAATFDALGSLNKRAKVGILGVKEVYDFIVPLQREDVKPGLWADQLFDAADAGTIEHDEVHGLMMDYIGPSLDTTIFGIGHMMFYLSQHQDQWQAIRDDPELATGAVNEALRMDAPIRAFTRYVTEDFEVGGVTIPKGGRAVVIYGSANRDERHYPDPDRFDITRNNGDHIGFGYGVHKCMGVHLAKLEMRILLEELAKKIERFECGEPKVAMNNVLRGFESMPMRLLA